jgi:hypothetical protein
MYKEGDVVLIKYNGQHCHGWIGSQDEFKKVKVIRYRGDFINSRGTDVPKGRNGWNTFIDSEGNYLSFSTSKENYILETLYLNYELETPKIDYEIY